MVECGDGGGRGREEKESHEVYTENIPGNLSTITTEQITNE
jgi:hypothetical protein